MLRAVLARLLCFSALFLSCSLVYGQPASFSVSGLLTLVDRPEDATPVEVLTFRLHPLGGGFDIVAQPNREGKFILSNVPPGPYSLTFPMPGRIVRFATGSRELAPEGFELSSGDTGPLVLVVSMTSGEVSLTIRSFPAGRNDLVALLAPADTHLTLRESCYANKVSGPFTLFPFVPPGNYRVFVFDAALQQDVAAYAPRFPVFLKDHATPITVPGTGRVAATASYVDGATIREAIRLVDPLNTLGRPK